MSSDPTIIGVFVLCFIALIPAIEAVRRWTGHAESRVISPHPLTVAPTIEDAFRNELRNLDKIHTARTDALRSEIREEMRGISEGLSSGFAEQSRESEDRSSKIHLRIDGLVQNIFQLKGALENHLREERRSH